MIAKRNNPARGIVPTVDPAGPAIGGFCALTSFRVHLLAVLSLRHAELRFQRRFGLRLLKCRILGAAIEKLIDATRLMMAQEQE